MLSPQPQLGLVTSEMDVNAPGHIPYDQAAGNHALCAWNVDEDKRTTFSILRIFRDERECENWQRENKLTPNQYVQWFPDWTKKIAPYVRIQSSEELRPGA